jgi:hypothetical protein
MKSVRNFSKFLLAALAAGAFLFSVSQAAIPAGYPGRPYPPGSAPHEIPGRISFHDYDYVPPSLGGSNGVTFVQDDQAGAANSNAGGRDGHIPGIPADSDNAWPALYLTWHVPSSDTFYAAGVVYPNGARYPSSDTSINDWYIGASHSDGMTKYTIHVPKGGKYWISSIWAADSWPIQFHINFINGATTVSTPTVTLNGSGSYHAWRRYSDFASIQLDSGVQVMQFQNGSMHLNQDFLYIAADSGQFTTAIRRIPAKSTSAGALNISLAQKTARFSIPDAGMTRVTVFDCLGREVFQIMNRYLAAGEHKVSVNTSTLKQGVYFLHVSHNGDAGVAKFQTFK